VRQPTLEKATKERIDHEEWEERGDEGGRTNWRIWKKRPYSQ